MSRGDYLQAIMDMKIPEQPKCKCGATCGLSFKYDRYWCFPCVWALVEKLREKIDQEPRL